MTSSDKLGLSSKIHFYLNVHVALYEGIAFWNIFMIMEEFEGNSIIISFSMASAQYVVAVS
jgi:hypothetical protein